MNADHLKKPTFEESIQKLETVVGELESGELSLEEGIEKFAAGVKSYKECKKLLTKVEKRITVLTESLDEEDKTSI